MSEGYQYRSEVDMGGYVPLEKRLKIAPYVAPVVLSVNSGLSDSQLWNSYNDNDFDSALTSLRSPSATVLF